MKPTGKFYEGTSAATARRSSSPSFWYRFRTFKTEFPGHSENPLSQWEYHVGKPNPARNRPATITLAVNPSATPATFSSTQRSLRADDNYRKRYLAVD